MKNLKKNNNKDILKLRNNLIMSDLKTSININDLLIGKELIFKDYYYNNITDMNISNVKKDSYGRNSITINKKKIEVFEYKNKDKVYYKPYKANIPLIETDDVAVKINNKNDFESDIITDDIKTLAINNGIYLDLGYESDECCECEYHEVIMSSNKKIDILNEIKTTNNIEVLVY